MAIPRLPSARTGNVIGSAAVRMMAVSIAVLAACCVPVWASGQDVGQPIGIHITVTDEKGQPVEQALAELHLQGQLVASALMDGAGKGSLTVQSAGSYLLTVSKNAYIKIEAIVEVRANSDIQEVDIALTRLGPSQQTITVHGTVSNPVAESASSQTTLAPTQAKDTPSKPATLTDALPLVPGVVRAKDGSVRIAGLGENHSALLVNSVNVTDPATGGFGLSVPIDSVETISVSEMPYLAQYGRFTAGVVTAETRRGGDKWDFSLNDPLPEFRIRSGHLVGLKTASPRANFSGPLMANRLYFLEGAEYLLYKQQVRTLPFPVNETQSTAINSFTQVDLVVSPTQILTASFHLAPHFLRYAGLDYFNPQPVTPNANFHESTGSIVDRLTLAGGVLQSTFAITRVGTGIHPQGTAEMVLNPLGNQGNYFNRQSREATRFEWIENWTPRTLHLGGKHTLQIGSVVDHSENEGRFQARPVQIQDSRGHLLRRIDFTSSRPFALADLEPGVFVQDH